MPASARVPAKLRMAQERLGHESACKSDVFQDAVMIALLRKQRLPAQRLNQPGASIATQKALSLDAAPQPPGEK